MPPTAAIALALLLAACGDQGSSAPAGSKDPDRSGEPSDDPSDPGEPGEDSAGTGGARPPRGGSGGGDARPRPPAADGGREPEAGESGGSAAGGSAADGGGEPTPPDAGHAGAGGQDSGVAGNPAGPDPTDELFDPENIPRFDIELPEESVAALSVIAGSDDPRQEEWVTGSFTYAGEVLANVGVRMKGEGSFRPFDRKAAFKIKFDEFVPDQNFRGLKRLTLNNMTEDPSFIAERLAYEVFRAAGLPAPRCNSALVYVNGEPYGVYANVETEDKAFLRRWFSDDEGNLYEEGQRDFVPGSESSFDLETNEAANDRTDVIGLIQALEASTATTLLADLAPHLDMDHFLRFTAAEAAVNQWDMYAYTLFWPNNFRFYSDPTTGKFVFLPWGMDMSMKPYRETGRAHIPVFTLARQFDLPDRAVSSGLIFQRCLESVECRERYAAAVAEIVAVYEDLDLEARAERYHAQIREHVLQDPRTEYPEDLFEAGHQSLLQTIRERPGAMKADLASQ